MKTDAQKRADANYKLGQKRVVFDFHRHDKTLARLDRLATMYGSKKAAIVAAIEALAPDSTPYAEGYAARAKGQPKEYPHAVSNKDDRIAQAQWLGGWHDRDMEE